MKKLNQKIAVFTLLSLTSCVVPEKVVQITEKVGVSGSIQYVNPESVPTKKFDPIQSKYTQRDFAGCFTALAIAPIVIQHLIILLVLTDKT